MAGGNGIVGRFSFFNFSPLLDLLSFFLYFRYLQPGMEPSPFYRRGDVLPIPSQEQPNGEVLSLLQSISMSLSDLQRQMSAMHEQNMQRDLTLTQIKKDMQEMKGTKRSNETQEDTPKRSRKSPRGLSVRL